MTLLEQVQAATAAAMRAHDERRRDALRMAVNALQGAQKTARRPLTDDESLAVLSREVKTRRESLDAFRAGGRDDLAAQEAGALEVLAEFLPAPLDEADLDRLVGEAIAESGASSPRDLGRVMKLLSPRVRGRADGRAVSERVTRALAASERGG